MGKPFSYQTPFNHAAPLAETRSEFRRHAMGRRDALKGRDEAEPYKDDPFYLSGYRDGLVERLTK